MFFLQDGASVAALEVANGRGRLRHPRLHQGPQMVDLLRRVRTIKRSTRSSELALLRVNALHLSCLLVRGHDPLVIPLSSVAPTLTEGATSSPAEFLDRVRVFARRVLPLHATAVRLSSRRPYTRRR